MSLATRAPASLQVRIIYTVIALPVGRCACIEYTRKLMIEQRVLMDAQVSAGNGGKDRKAIKIIDRHRKLL